jgi:hypothetical protein
MNVSKFNRRLAVYKKCNGHCAYCGKVITVQQLTIDHILAKSLKNQNHINNYLPACKACNNLKGLLSVEQFRKKNMLLEDLDSLIFYFEQEEFAEALQEEILIAHNTLDEEYLLDDLDIIRKNIKKQQGKLNVIEMSVNRNIALVKRVERLQNIINEKIFEDKMLFKLKKRLDIDDEFIQDLKKLIYTHGDDEMKLAFHSMNQDHGDKIFELNQEVAKRFDNEVETVDSSLN